MNYKVRLFFALSVEEYPFVIGAASRSDGGILFIICSGDL